MNIKVNFLRSTSAWAIILIAFGTIIWYLKRDLSAGKSDLSAGKVDIDGLISQLHEPANKTRIILRSVPGGEMLEYTPPMRQLIALGDAARLPLVRRLNEDGIQNEVALVLGEIGNEATVPVLIEAFQDIQFPDVEYDYQNPDPAFLNVVCFTKALCNLTSVSIGHSRWGTDFNKENKQKWRDWWANSQKTFWVKEHTAQPNRTLKSVPQILAQLNAALRDADSRVREAAANAFRELEHEAAPSVPNLIAAFENDENLEVRRAAVFAFCRIGPEGAAAIPALIKLVCHDPDSEIREDAEISLARIGEAAIPSLKQLLDDPSAQARRHAIRAIGEMYPKQTWAVPAFLRLSKDPDSNVRGRAYGYMRVISPNDPEVLKALILGLSDPDSAVRSGCAYDLQAIGPNAWSAEALRAMGTDAKKAVPLLIQALTDQENLVRTMAKTALLKIDPEAAAKADVE